MSGGFTLEELIVTMTFPTGVPVLPRLDLEGLKGAHVKVDRLVFRISKDWINKILASARELTSKGLTAELGFSDGDPTRFTVSGSFKRAVPYALDFILGIQGNLLYLKIDEIRFLKFLPLLAMPGLKDVILNAVKDALPKPLARMNQKEIFIDVLSQVPLPMTLRWRRFQTQGSSLVIEAAL